MYLFQKSSFSFATAVRASANVSWTDTATRLQYAPSLPSVWACERLILPFTFEECLNSRAGDLSTEAAPVRIEDVIVAGQENDFVSDT